MHIHTECHVIAAVGSAQKLDYAVDDINLEAA